MGLSSFHELGGQSRSRRQVEAKIPVHGMKSVTLQCDYTEAGMEAGRSLRPLLDSILVKLMQNQRKIHDRVNLFPICSP